jgi:hypothetical protein
MIKINIKNLTNLVESMEAIDEETKGNDFYGCYIEYKKPIILLMTEFYFAFPDTYELYTIESFNECSEDQRWIQVLAKYIGFTGVDHMIRWFNVHPEIWKKGYTFQHCINFMRKTDGIDPKSVTAQRITIQWRQILDLLIKEKK